MARSSSSNQVFQSETMNSDGRQSLHKLYVFKGTVSIEYGILDIEWTGGEVSEG